MSAIITSLVSTWMCLGCMPEAQAAAVDTAAPVSVVVADQKTAALRISDTLATARKHRLRSIGQLVRLRILEDANFAHRAEALARRMGQRIDAFATAEIVRPSTGADFLDELVAASRQGPIGNLVIYGHAAPTALYMMEDRGFYRSVQEVAASTLLPSPAGVSKEAELRRLGARDLGDLQKLLQDGAIRFAPDAVVVFTGCAAAGEKSLDPAGIAARMAEITKATVVASLGVTDQSMAGRRRNPSPDEFSRGTWVRFAKDAKPEKLGTRVLDPLRALHPESEVAPGAELRIELSPPFDARRYWCAAASGELACGLRQGERLIADAP